MQFAKHWAATLDDYAIDLAWSPDGTLLAAASQGGAITLFDAATGAIHHALPGHTDGTNCLAWMPVGRRTEDGAPATDQPTEPPSTTQGPPSSVLRPPPSATQGPPSSVLRPPPLLATGGQDGCVRFWNADVGSLAAEARLGTAWVEHLAWLPVVQRTDDNCRKSDQTTEPPTATQRVPSSDLRPPSSDVRPLSSVLRPPSSVLLAAAGKKLFALSADGTVAHAFPDAPKTIAALAVLPPPFTPSPSPSALRPLPSALATACFGHVVVRDAGTFATLKEYTYGNAIHALAWSPDGRWLVAGCQDNAVHLWAPAEDVELHMSGYETKLRELSFSRDGRWLATGGGRDACVWDCSGAGPEGREPQLLPHSQRVVAVAFQRTHGLLATGDAGGVFTLWAPTRKNPMVAEVTMPAAATKIAWNADDSLLAVGTEQGHVFVFRTA